MGKYSELIQAVTEMDNGRQEYEAFHGKSESFFNNSLHSHDFYEILIHISGINIYQIEDHTYHLKRGDMVIARPFQIHGHCGAEPLYNYERLLLYITPEMLSRISCNVFPLQKELDAKLRMHQFVFPMTDEQVKVAMTCIDKMQANIAANTRAAKLHDISLMIELMLLVLDCMDTVDPSYATSEAEADLMQQIASYINEHFHQPLTLERIAEQFCLSKSSLSHRFVEYAGHSVYDYILYCRIVYAKRLIVAGEPLTAAAYRCGFGDYSNFQRAFSNFTGCSAREYKKRIQAHALRQSE